MLLSTIFSPQNMYSDDMTEVLNKVLRNVSTPTAQDLGKYGEIPMNLYTGRANVSIPIYQTVQKDVPLNISLTYDTGGMLLNQLPSWTGHGWTLCAGGCITRKQQGYYDEDENKARLVSRTPMPYMVNYFNNTRVIDNQSNEDIADDVTNATTVYDYSPDIFVFNFMGKYGRFFLGTDKKWHVQCDENIKVEFDITNSSNYILPFIPNYPNRSTTMSKTIKGFTLIDENGIKYKFGGTTDAIEYSIGFLDQDVEDWRANTWYLTEIQDRFGNVLYEFNYTRGKFLTQIFNNLVQISVNYQFSNGWVSQHQHTAETTAKFPFAITLNSPVYLSNITTFDKTHIDFNISETTKIPLTDFYPSFNNYCQSSVYFGDGTSYQNAANIPYILNLSTEHSINNDNYLCYLRNHLGYAANYIQYWDEDMRHIIETQYSNNTSLPSGGVWNNPLAVLSFNPLQSIAITSQSDPSNVKTVKHVDFVYNMQSRLHITSLNIYGSDYESENRSGYAYNMEYNNYNLLPADYLCDEFDYWGYYNNSSSANTPNTVTTQYGMLSKLTYPTGGYSEFQYEQNNCSQYLNDEKNGMICDDENQYVGGLRISQIKDYTVEGELFKTRNFSYDNIGYDEWLSSGQCYRIPRPERQEAYYEHFTSSQYVNKDILYYYQKSSAVPLTDSYNSHIGYTHVTETTDNIRKEYRYTNHSDYFDETPLRVANETYNYRNLSSPYVKFTDLGFTRGKLLQERIYEGSDMRYECNYVYNPFLRNKYALSTTLSRICDVHLANGSLVGCVYKMYYCNLELLKKWETYYYGNGSQNTDVSEFQMEDWTPVGANNYDPLRKLTSEKVSRTIGGTDYDAYEKHYQYLSTETNDYFFPMTDVLTYRNGILVTKKTQVYNYFSNVPGHKLPQREYHSFYPYINNEHVTITYDGYDNKGQLLQYTETGKASTYLTWDNLGRLIQSVSGSNNNFVTTYEYTSDGLLKKTTSPNTYSKNYLYDSMGRLKTVFDSEGVLQQYNYNYKNRIQ